MTKLYYTESIQVTEIPKYLPNNKVDYEIKFSEGYQPITGNLANGTTIRSFSVKNSAVRATLSLKVDGNEIKKIRLNLNEQVQTRKVSLKSTVSQTCEEPNTTCSFELKFNIYKIDRSTHKANLLSFSEIEALQNKKSEKTGYFIHRLSGHLSLTSKITIDLINNPESIKNKYIKKAMEIFKRLSNQYTQYPRLIYRDLMKELFEHFLKGSSDPDTVVEEISDIFGVNVGDCYTTEIRAFYHVYEALIRKNEADAGYDKIQHFTYNVGKQYSSTKIGTDIAQYGGEVIDLVKGGTSVWDDSKSDMEANNLGQAYGWELYKKYHPVRATIRSLD